MVVGKHKNTERDRVVAIMGGNDVEEHGRRSKHQGHDQNEADYEHSSASREYYVRLDWKHNNDEP